MCLVQAAGCSRGWASNPTSSGEIRSVWGEQGSGNPCHRCLPPGSALLATLADAKGNQDGHVTSPSPAAHPAHIHPLPQERGPEARVSPCRHGGL